MFPELERMKVNALSVEIGPNRRLKTMSRDGNTRLSFLQRFSCSRMQTLKWEAAAGCSQRLVGNTAYEQSAAFQEQAEAGGGGSSITGLWSGILQHPCLGRHSAATLGYSSHDGKQW